MPQERLPMRKIRDVLRLSADGLSKRKIAASLGLSATAAGDCIRRARAAGVAWPVAAEFTDAALEQLLYRSATPVEKHRRIWRQFVIAIRLDQKAGGRQKIAQDAHPALRRLSGLSQCFSGRLAFGDRREDVQVNCAFERLRQMKRVDASKEMLG